MIPTSTNASTRARILPGLAAVAAMALSISACGGAKVGQDTAAPSGGSGKCGSVNLAVNAWVGYRADAAVVSYVAEHQLGCKVVKKNLDEQVSWQGFGTGEVDAILENWGHEDLAQKYITEQKVAQDAGQTGNIGVIGWYVPPFLAKEHPDIVDWKNLNKYADLFKTSESGGKGELLDGDPGFVTNDGALVKNLNLDYKVVYAGSEAALITSFRMAESTQKPMIGYFYSPQWFLADVPLVKVNLPPYTTGCDAVPAKVGCDYPPYNLNKVVSTKFAQSGSPAYRLVKGFHWTNDDQNAVAKSIQGGMSDDAAAKKWVEANPGQVKAWLGS
ncbi:ABC transporter substrate-binding protein [Dermatophilaceae bacterium Soc4.6]